MAKYRNGLPQLDGNKFFLSDSGLETTLVFHEGIELPHFAAFPLLETQTGRQHLQRYFERHLEIAISCATGFVLDTPTWRANPDWGARLGYSLLDLDRINRAAVSFVEQLRADHEAEDSPMVINGVIGPRGDGYKASDETNTVEEYCTYHKRQIESFTAAGADMVTALTMTTTQEAKGILQAAVQCALPIVISFTVETDGCLPSGQTLEEAIKETDAHSAVSPIYYMVNCAHPTHFKDSLDIGASWTQRIRGIRANASRLSHVELDEATELDDGQPDELATEYAALMACHPQLRVFGGCCGTDHRHIRKIAEVLCRNQIKAA